jgi:hypothetical protein
MTFGRRGKGSLGEELGVDLGHRRGAELLGGGGR